MCNSCQPGLAQWAQVLTKNVDVSNSPPPQVPSHARTVDDDTVTLFFGGPIVTMRGGDFNPVEALVVTGSTIAFTGLLVDAEKAAGPKAARHDLKQQALLPGFIDPHVHLIFSALAGHSLISLSPIAVRTLQAAVTVLREHIESGNLSDGWAAGYGYDPSRVQNHADLTKEVLDSVSTDVPIFVINASGHLGYANSKAFELSEVTAESVRGNPDFQVDEHGQLTGLLFEKALGAISKNVPPPSGPKLIQDSLATLQSWSAQGVTTVFDAGVGVIKGPADLTLFQNLPPAPVRLYGALAASYFPAAEPLTPPLKYGELEVRAAKFWSDGSTQGFTAAVRDTYLNPPSWANPEGKGILIYDTANALEAALKPFFKAGYQLLVHANGDAASDLVLTAYEQLFQGVKPSLLHRIEHFTVVHESQVKRAKDLNLSVSHLIGHVYYWGSAFKNCILGEKRAKDLDPAQWSEKHGVIWSTHSDSPITAVNPLLHIKIATTRKLYELDEVLGPDQRVDLVAAVRAVTVNPAKQIGIYDSVGSLEVGKQADLVLLSADPRQHPPDQLDNLAVISTWVGGSLAYTRPSSPKDSALAK